MSHRVCLLALSLLLLCTLAVAAPSDPVKSAPAVTPTTSVISPNTGDDLPAGTSVTPPWLAPGPAMSVNRPAARDPRAPIPLDCQGACLQAKNQCYTDCNDDEACETGCDNDWWCCSNACRGYFCQ